ncbi:MAG: UDP-N-acetylmuramoyl-L-alanine--D-glutamate ligase [Pseudomonadota bacterium]
MDYYCYFSVNWIGIIKNTLTVLKQNTSPPGDKIIKNNGHIFDYQLKTLIVGLGETGYSCAKFLVKKKCPFEICDTRKDAPYEKLLHKYFPEVKLISKAKIDYSLLQQYEQIIVSPGISTRDESFVQFKQQGKTIIGDIALFIQENIQQGNKPVIAVTGSNGKSTVVTLAEHILKQAGHKVVAGGNLGVPALDLLEMDAEIYILELSSFQLETIPERFSFLEQRVEQKAEQGTKPSITQNIFTSAVLLNVSEDHMDRYDSLDDYRKVKESVFNLSKHCVFNKNEWLFDKALKENQQQSYSEFSLNNPEKNGYGLVNEEGKTYLAQAICCQPTPLFKKIMPVDDIAISGKHNYSNILATLALLEPFVISDSNVVKAIQTYKGLAHRCEWVANIGQVDYYNDSKGTNAGATIAAINSYDRPKLLIAGGVGKNADFSELGQIINQKIKYAILMGQDAAQIKNSIENEQPLEQEESDKKQALLSIEMVENMQQAVLKAEQLAEPGDLVLFSPACASFDMYKNYIERGNDFICKVKNRVKQQN